MQGGTTAFLPFPEFSTTMLTSDIANAWSVSGDTLNSADVASNLFASSLFPYLGFLWFLSRPETNTPKGVNFGFRFLLVFVFLTIPAGIYAKVAYSDILANIDWLHGGAESFLTMTNFFIIYGFRADRPKPEDANQAITSNIWTQATLVASAALVVASFVVNSHPEPGNALSLPTWIIHSSSLLEWLYAMKLVWEHAEVSGNPRWKNLTWAMIPSHTSGICACTYHLFYNAKALTWIVNLQAFLTCAGNAALAVAAYRIYAYGKEQGASGLITAASAIEGQGVDGQDASPTALSQPLLEESDAAFNTDMLLKSLLVAVVVKYGELFFDVPFEARTGDALAIIFIPTLLNVLKWGSRSMQSATATTEMKQT